MSYFHVFVLSSLWRYDQHLLAVSSAMGDSQIHQSGAVLQLQCSTASSGLSLCCFRDTLLHHNTKSWNETHKIHKNIRMTLMFRFTLMQLQAGHAQTSLHQEQSLYLIYVYATILQYSIKYESKQSIVTVRRCRNVCVDHRSMAKRMSEAHRSESELEHIHHFNLFDVSELSVTSGLCLLRPLNEQTGSGQFCSNSPFLFSICIHDKGQQVERF